MLSGQGASEGPHERDAMTELVRQAHPAFDISVLNLVLDTTAHHNSRTIHRLLIAISPVVFLGKVVRLAECRADHSRSLDGM